MKQQDGLVSEFSFKWVTENTVIDTVLRVFTETRTLGLSWDL